MHTRTCWYLIDDDDVNEIFCLDKKREQKTQSRGQLSQLTRLQLNAHALISAGRRTHAHVSGLDVEYNER